MVFLTQNAAAHDKCEVNFVVLSITNVQYVMFIVAYIMSKSKFEIRQCHMCEKDHILL